MRVAYSSDGLMKAVLLTDKETINAEISSKRQQYIEVCQ